MPANIQVDADDIPYVDADDIVWECENCPCDETTDRCCGGTFPSTMYCTCYLYESSGWPTWTYTGVSSVIEVTYDPNLKLTNDGGATFPWTGGWKGTSKFDPSGPTVGVAFTCQGPGSPTGIVWNVYQDQGSGIDFYDGVDDLYAGSDGLGLYKFLDTPRGSTGGLIDCDTKVISEYQGEVERAAQASFFPLDWDTSIPDSQDFNFTITP